MKENPGLESVEKKLKTFYDNTGWAENFEGNTKDALFFEDLRDCARSYVSHCRLRLLPYLKKGGDQILDAASGPIQYSEYLLYSKNFNKRVCVDISQVALDRAKAKLGSKGDYICCGLENLPLATNSFDAIVSLHTIYHIDKDLQAKAVQELIRVVRPGSPILIVYSNPFPWHSRLIYFFEKMFWERPRLLKAFRRLIRRDLEALKVSEHSPEKPIYFFPYSLEWWQQFSGQCDVRIVSWRFVTAEESQKWIPNNILGRGFFRLLRVFEFCFPKLASQWCAYPLIILTKKS